MSSTSSSPSRRRSSQRSRSSHGSQGQGRGQRSETTESTASAKVRFRDRGLEPERTAPYFPDLIFRATLPPQLAEKGVEVTQHVALGVKRATQLVCNVSGDETPEGQYDGVDQFRVSYTLMNGSSKAISVVSAEVSARAVAIGRIAGTDWMSGDVAVADRTLPIELGPRKMITVALVLTFQCPQKPRSFHFWNRSYLARSGPIELRVGFETRKGNVSWSNQYFLNPAPSFPTREDGDIWFTYIDDTQAWARYYLRARYAPGASLDLLLETDGSTMRLNAQTLRALEQTAVREQRKEIALDELQTEHLAVDLLVDLDEKIAHAVRARLTTDQGHVVSYLRYPREYLAGKTPNPLVVSMNAVTRVAPALPGKQARRGLRSPWETPVASLSRGSGATAADAAKHAAATVTAASATLSPGPADDMTSLGSAGEPGDGTWAQRRKKRAARRKEDPPAPSVADADGVYDD